MRAWAAHAWFDSERDSGVQIHGFPVWRHTGIRSKFVTPNVAITPMQPNPMRPIHQLIVAAALIAGAMHSTSATAQCDFPTYLNLRVLLDGPMDNSIGLMSDTLRAQGLLPLTEPYTALGYAHRGGGGGETMDPAMLLTEGSDAIVDWVVVELRHPNDPGKRIATKTALLKRNGEVMAANGQSLAFCVPEGSYQVAVRHRNHLGVITNRSVLLDGGPLLIDFSNTNAPNTTRGGKEALKPLNADSTLWGLWPGDVNFDGIVRYTGLNNDRDPILVNIGGTVPTTVTNDQYTNPDVNMDSHVKYVGMGNDRDPVLVTIGGAVPTKERKHFIPEDSLVFKPNVHFVDPATWVLDHDDSDTDSATVLVFHIQGAMPTVETGHTLVVYDAGGWIRVVTNVLVVGNTMTVESTPGTFLDMIESGVLQYDLHLDTDAAQESPSMSSRSFGPLNLVLPNGVGIQGGILNFSNSLNFDLFERGRVGPSGFVEIERGIEGSMVAKGKLALQGQLAAPSAETPPLFLGAIPLPGPFGIPLLVHFTVQAAFEGNVAVTTGYDLDFNMNGSLAMGVRRTEESSSNFFDYHLTGPSLSPEDAGPANINFGGEVDIFLKATLLVGGVPVGGYFEVGPNFRLETASSTSGHHTAFTAGGKATMGIGLVDGSNEANEFALEGSWSTNPLLEWKSPGRLEYVSGSDQTGSLDTPLEDPIVVRSLTTLRFRSQEYASWPSAGDEIKFEPCPTCGTLEPDDEPTQQDGTARRTWTLGQGQPGVSQQTLVVSLKDGTGGDIAGSPLSINAEASPLRLELVGGDNQQGIPSMSLQSGLEFRVVGSLSPYAPVPNVTVRFELASGGGEVTTPEVITDNNGSGFGLWTLGSYTDGEQKVRASLLDANGDHVEGSPIDFTARFRPLQIQEEAGNNQLGLPGEVLGDEIRFRLVSDFGLSQFNMEFPIPNVPVHLEVLGGGTVYPVDAVSDAIGVVTAAWSLGDDCLAGDQRIEVTAAIPENVVEVQPPVLEFKAAFGQVRMKRPVLDGNEQAGASNELLAEPLRVWVVDMDGAPVSGYPVAFSVNSGGGSIAPTVSYTDSSGIAEANWTLGEHPLPQEAEAILGVDFCYSIDEQHSSLIFTAALPCPATMTDIDGNEYDVVNIGGQCWTKQNLRVTHYNNGVEMENLSLEEWESHFLESPIAYYPTPAGTLGGNLYQTTENDRLCPLGWRVPRVKDFAKLHRYLRDNELDASDPDGFALVPSAMIYSRPFGYFPDELPYARIYNFPYELEEGSGYYEDGRFITSSFSIYHGIEAGPSPYTVIFDHSAGELVGTRMGEYEEFYINPINGGYPCRCIRGTSSREIVEFPYRGCSFWPEGCNED